MKGIRSVLEEARDEIPDLRDLGGACGDPPARPPPDDNNICTARRRVLSHLRSFSLPHRLVIWASWANSPQVRPFIWRPPSSCIAFAPCGLRSFAVALPGFCALSLVSLRPSSGRRVARNTGFAHNIRTRTYTLRDGYKTAARWGSPSLSKLEDTFRW